MENNMDAKGSFEIRLDGMGRGEVFYNGDKIKGVTKIVYESGVNELSLITVTFIAHNIEIADTFKEMENDNGKE